MKLVFFGKFARETVGGAIAAVPDVLLSYAEEVSELAEAVVDAEGLILVGPAFSAEVAAAVSGAPKLRWIQTLSAGYENLQRFGIPREVTVTNAGDSWAIPVAEHAMGLLLALVKHLPEAVKQQERREWGRHFAPQMSSLQGRTMALVGFGAIGKAVAQRARAFGMDIIAVTRSGKPSELASRVYPTSELKSALKIADVVVVAVPSHGDTMNLMNAETLRACKAGSILINVARGDVVDQDALGDALHSGHLSGAGLDVTNPEPLPETSSLWDAPNLLITPHVAGGGNFVTNRLAELAVENVSRQLRGQELRCVVIAGKSKDAGRESAHHTRSALAS
ncbi:D-2-hydroxyacid dehydrogenase [Paraburkholderia sp. JHI869]|uniref:D-2-hydroxyacid dehydrogenase n=1 Tax=Paraburkholderia sp. JHI869 TaxID=3112959 RepID=UPI0031708E2C